MRDYFLPLLQKDINLLKAHLLATAGWQQLQDTKLNDINHWEAKETD